MRELLGKKLTARHRNALDDVSEKTKVPLRSCRRQVNIVDSNTLCRLNILIGVGRLTAIYVTDHNRTVCKQ